MIQHYLICLFNSNPYVESLFLVVLKGSTHASDRTRIDLPGKAPWSHDMTRTHKCNLHILRSESRGTPHDRIKVGAENHCRLYYYYRSYVWSEYWYVNEHEKKQEICQCVSIHYYPTVHGLIICTTSLRCFIWVFFLFQLH